MVRIVNKVILNNDDIAIVKESIQNELGHRNPVRDNEIITRRIEQLYAWPYRSDVWSLLYGPKVAGIAVGFTALMTNIQARQLFNITTGRFYAATSFAPVLLSSASFFAVFDLMVKRKILLSDSNPLVDCDLCLEMRGSAVQAFCGCILSSGLSLLTSTLVAITYRTYPVPSLIDGKGLWRLTKLYARGIRVYGPLMLAGHAALGSLLVRSMVNSNRYMATQQRKSIAVPEPTASET